VFTKKQVQIERVYIKNDILIIIKKRQMEINQANSIKLKKRRHTLRRGIKANMWKTRPWCTGQF
jgi:hypothetical protein